MAQVSLTAKDAIKIAALHGLSYRCFKRDIRENLIAARAEYGTAAEDRFSIWMANIAAENFMDSMAARDFAEQAYGELR